MEKTESANQNPLEFGYQKIRDWYQKNVAQLDNYENREWVKPSRRLILALPPKATELEMRAIMREVRTGLLEWGYSRSDGEKSMNEYAREAVGGQGYDLSREEENSLRRESPLGLLLNWRSSEIIEESQPPSG